MARGDIIVLGSVANRLRRYSDGKWSGNLDGPIAENGHRFVMQAVDVRPNGDLVVSAGASSRATGQDLYVQRAGQTAWTELRKPPGGTFEGLVARADSEIVALSTTIAGGQASPDGAIYEWRNNAWSRLANLGARSGVRDIAARHDGGNLVYVETSAAIRRFNLATRAFDSTRIAFPAGTSSSGPIAIDEDGNLVTLAFGQFGGSHATRFHRYSNGAWQLLATPAPGFAAGSMSISQEGGPAFSGAFGATELVGAAWGATELVGAASGTEEADG